MEDLYHQQYLPVALETSTSDEQNPGGCCYELGILLVSVLILKSSTIWGSMLGPPDFWKSPGKIESQGPPMGLRCNVLLFWPRV